MNACISDPRKDFFDRNAEEWDSFCPDYTKTDFFKFWLKHLPLKSNSRILEIGCGTGKVLPILDQECLKADPRINKKSNLKNSAPTGFADHIIIGLDFSLKMLQQAAKRILNNSSIFLVQSNAAYSLPFAENQFQLILILDTSPHLKPFPKVLQECRRVLEDKGQIQIVHFAGCEQINKIHRECGGAIAEDLILPASVQANLLTKFGFEIKHCEDEETHYWLAADTKMQSKK